MSKLTERNGQYLINGNLAGFDEVIVYLKEDNTRLQQENKQLHKQLQSWVDACDCGVE